MKRPVRKRYGWHAAAWASSYQFPLSSPGASIYAKQAEILAAKDGTICREGCPVIFHIWPLSRHLSNCFWISEPLLVRTKYFVFVCSTNRLSLPCMRLDHDSCQVMKFFYMRTTCSVTIQNMGRNWNWTYWTNWYLCFCFYILYVLNMSSKHLALQVIKYV